MSQPSSKTRRNLFAGLGVVAAATVAAKLAPGTHAPPAAAPPDPADGYRLSEHIKKYYRTTTV
ncbi:MAG: hypothetical protein V4463_08750 [Pseudomonadota bacterium]